MELGKILKVQFLNQEAAGGLHRFNGWDRSPWLPTDWKIVESNIEFEDLLELISDIESHLPVSGIKNLHEEAFDGVDYLGNVVKFSSYVIWQDNKHDRRIIDDEHYRGLNFRDPLPGIIYKYNFDENLIPFNHEILRRSRNNKINKVYS